MCNECYDKLEQKSLLVTVVKYQKAACKCKCSNDILNEVTTIKQYNMMRTVSTQAHQCSKCQHFVGSEIGTWWYIGKKMI